MGQSTPTEVRLALVGCGAIAQAHAQAIAAIDGVRCTALFDTDPTRAETLRRTFFPEARVVDELAQIGEHSDAAIVAAPNAYHAPIALQLLRAGLHVLCEKPLATTLADAQEMAGTATRLKRVLACGLARRFAGSTALATAALQHEIVGRARRFEIRESVWNWPLNRATFDPNVSGGGVLIDIGPHVFDLLAAWFGPVELIEYRDDNSGRVESTAWARVLCRAPHGEIAGDIFLTRAQQTMNRARIYCDGGFIDVDPHQRTHIELTFVTGRDKLVTTAQTSFTDPLGKQLQNFIGAISGIEELVVPTRAAVATVALVESCYRNRKPLAAAWNDMHAPATVEEPRSPYRKILVTGATGKVGSRLVEMWSERGRLNELRCMVRSYRAAARLMRFPVETVEADLLDLESIRRAASGCDAIIHLGVGERAERETISLLRVARELGIHRFIHMSSAAVYGIHLPPQITEQQEESKTRKLGEPYADQKVGAENAVLRECARGLESIVLRPHIVYGPYMRWSSELFDLLALGRLPIIEDGGYCNLIYVDDLIEAVMRGLTAKSGFGQPMFITDGVPIAWREYIEAHAALSRSNPPRVLRAEVQRPKLSAGEWLKASVRPLAPVMRSKEFRAFVFESPAMQSTLFRAYLALRDKPLLSPLVANLGSGKTAMGAPNGETSYHELWTDLQLSEAKLSAARAESLLGFRARIAFAEGLRRMALWAGQYGLINEAQTPAPSTMPGAEVTLVET